MLTRTRRPMRASPRASERMFSPGRLTLGVFFPIEAFQGDEPTMRDQERLARGPKSWTSPRSGSGTSAPRPELRRRRAGLRPLGLSRLDRGADPHDRAGHRLARPPLAPPAAHRQGVGFGRPALGRPARARRRVRRPAGRVPGVRRRLRTARALFRENLRVIREVLADEFPRSDRPMACSPGRPTSCPSRPAGCRSWSPAPAGRPWNGSPSMPTAGSPTRGPSSGRRNWPRLAGRRGGRGAGRVQAVRSVVLRRPVRRPGPTAEPIHLGFRGGRNVVFRFLDGLRAVGVHHVILNLNTERATRPRSSKRSAGRSCRNSKPANQRPRPYRTRCERGFTGPRAGRAT